MEHVDGRLAGVGEATAVGEAAAVGIPTATVGRRRIGERKAAVNGCIGDIAAVGW